MRSNGLLIALPALALVACTSTSPLSAAEQGESDSPAVTTTTTPSLPPRPAEVLLTDVDPCAVLSESQRAQLSLDGTPSPYVDEGLGNARACTMRSRTSGNVVRLALITVQGVEVWLDENAQVEATPTTVAGYPALTVRTPGLDDVCNVEVDVAEGQFLDVMFRDGGNATPAQQDTLCLGAQRSAEAAMTGLLAVR
ncbi:DUF3558 domain-containing protein [Umezawaea beigongshangensis]|uniref:DUF3558 domain-containing protein n=1 Tax=Umezawaea beigongshangensis TaxID=2780383 RepID=UPI0027DCA07F|nr:DUF3558 domain-containing protein [Umezawaea beigongshangensis]